MTQLILHHFDASPFAEKIRLIFGMKNLTWHSVEIPMIMPKPDLTVLTGGYRKTPVLQIGADIYCDTWLIADIAEKVQPSPTLFPNGGRGLAMALSRWSDKAFFEPGAALSMGENPQVPEAVIEDRKAFFNFMDFDQLESALPEARRQLQAHAALVEADLMTGGPFLDGTAPGYRDMLAWFVIWMAYGNIPTVETLMAPFPGIRAWAERMRSVGHGERKSMTASQAIAIAATSEPAGLTAQVEDNPLALTRGQRVAVFADDYGQDQIVGNLEQLDRERIVISRKTDLTKALHVHFPAVGYSVKAIE